MTRQRLLLVASLLAVAMGFHRTARAATTTYTGAWAGGTIAAGDTVVLDAGASVGGPVQADGVLQFNQTTALTMSQSLTGTGRLALTNTGTFILTGLASGTARFDMTAAAANGGLDIGATGTNALIVGATGTGTLSVTGGTVRNGLGFLGFGAGSFGAATVTGGTWASAAGAAGRILYLGYSGTGVLDVSGGLVTNANGYLGFASGAVGTATVSGGSWTNRGTLYVGGAVGGSGGTGTLTIAGGNVSSVTAYVGSNATAAGSVIVTGGTWTTSANVNVGTSGTGTLAISGSGGSGGVVVVGGTLAKGSGGTITLAAGGTLHIGSGTTSGGLATDLVNSGAIVFNRTGSGTVAASISGTGSLAVAGAATLRFTGTSSYTGPTTLDAGTLLVNGGLGVTPVAVNAGVTLGGTGTILGPVAAGSGSILTPGDGIGVLTIGAATFSNGSAFSAELNSSGPVAADLLRVAGNLSLSGTVGLSLTDLAASPLAFADGTTVSLINYTGSWNGGLLSRAGESLANGGTFSVGAQLWRIEYDATAGGTNFSGQYLPASHFVNVVAVPEPSAWILAVAALVAVRCRRPRAP